MGGLGSVTFIPKRHDFIVGLRRMCLNLRYLLPLMHSAIEEGPKPEFSKLGTVVILICFIHCTEVTACSASETRTNIELHKILVSQVS